MPIELDLTPQQRRAQIIRNCGAKPIGENPPGVVQFTDPITKTTLALYAGDIKEEKVRQKIAESRLKFGYVLIEQVVLNNMELFEQLKSMLQSLEGLKDIPENVIIAAANAATMEIVSFKIANEPELENHAA